MADVSKQMAWLVEEIKKTDTFVEYEKQKERIQQYPDLKMKVDEFRRKNYQYQTSAPTEQLFDLMDSLQKEYEQFRENPIVHDFLKAELDYCRMIQSMNDYLYQEFTLDFDW